MKCSDIPTQPILEHIEIHGGIGCSWNIGDKRDVRNAMPNGFNLPPKLVHAKMRQLINNDLVDGCCCGCRGDFELLPRGRQQMLKGK